MTSTATSVAATGCAAEGEADDGMAEIVAEFLTESRESLDQLDSDLVELERAPGDRDRLSSVFRALHTIKGNAGFLGFAPLQAVAHAAESLLARLREGDLPFDAPRASALLDAVDAVREMLDGIEADGAEGGRDDAPLVARLGLLATVAGAAAETDPAQPDPSQPAPAEPGPSELGPSELGPSELGPAELGPSLAGPSLPGARQPQSAASRGGEGAPGGCPAAGDEGEHSSGPLRDATVRVDVDVLDRLVDLVGELVLARNQLVQRIRDTDDAELAATAQRFDLVTSELHDRVMRTRMQPISTMWSRFPRVVRDLAVTCGRQVRLEMEGSETELDRSILEAIRDPLLHLIRNSVDHGVEPAEARAARGKPAEGRLTLRACQEGGSVNIEIADDGAGIDVERVRAKAIAAERDPERLDALRNMPAREVVNLIFSPGLSTAATVTSVSGRGVGMDVVKNHVERVGGTIEVVTAAGLGTTFKIRLPLTLAIMPVLIVCSGGQRYAIPEDSVVELVRLTGSQSGDSIEQVAGADVYRLRGELLPLVDLGAVLGRPERDAEEPPLLVVLDAAGRRFGLVVAAASEIQQIVVKPLDKLVAAVKVFSGATVLGDGGIALILEVDAVASRAGILAGDAGRPAPAGKDLPPAGERTCLLVLRVGADRRVAVPLRDVSRLEYLAASAVEHVRAGRVVQYRGRTLPLVSLPALFASDHVAGSDVAHSDAADSDAAGELPVVVTEVTGRPVGLVAREILDIVDGQVAIERTACGGGVVGSAIVGGHVTDLLELTELIGSTLAPPSPGEPDAPGTTRA
jgi:two-component system chemotaxis sensor kinase CheA